MLIFNKWCIYNGSRYNWPMLNSRKKVFAVGIIRYPIFKQN